ncbi:hypothetical protein PIB30_100765 [Stylosanthes scabra]|uniref:Uncharacterized protein n=1 Tax=Stylosanthes scabra TaxID=79078 RepID=A0ABU6UZX5_9FABA|nr:hypothetical protein [Stylosanthes scabra]
MNNGEASSAASSKNDGGGKFEEDSGCGFGERWLTSSTMELKGGDGSSVNGDGETMVRRGSNLELRWGFPWITAKTNSKVKMMMVAAMEFSHEPLNGNSCPAIVLVSSHASIVKRRFTLSIVLQLVTLPAYKLHLTFLPNLRREGYGVRNPSLAHCVVLNRFGQGVNRL